MYSPESVFLSFAFMMFRAPLDTKNRDFAVKTMFFETKSKQSYFVLYIFYIKNRLSFVMIPVPKTHLRARKCCNLQIKLNICIFGIKIEVNKKHDKSNTDVA